MSRARQELELVMFKADLVRAEVHNYTWSIVRIEALNSLNVTMVVTVVTNLLVHDFSY